MPNIKSAKKRVKVTDTKTLKNKIAKSQLRTELKKVRAEIEENKSAEALKDVYKRQSIYIPPTESPTAHTGST